MKSVNLALMLSCMAQSCNDLEPQCKVNAAATLLFTLRLLDETQGTGA